MVMKGAMMRRGVLIGVMAAGLGLLGGCALFQGGTDADGNPTPAPITTIVGGVASVLGYGWIGTLLGVVTTGYATWKGSGWKKAAVSTFAAIEAWKKANPAVWEGLKAKLGAEHADAHVTKLVDKALEKVEVTTAS
jgi:hypothetical protein